MYAGDTGNILYTITLYTFKTYLQSIPTCTREFMSYNIYKAHKVQVLLTIYMRGSGCPQSEYADAHSGSCVAQAGREAVLAEATRGTRRAPDRGGPLAMALALVCTLLLETDLLRLLLLLLLGLSRPAMPTAGNPGTTKERGEEQGDDANTLSVRQ